MQNMAHGGDMHIVCASDGASHHHPDRVTEGMVFMTWFVHTGALVVWQLAGRQQQN